MRFRTANYRKPLFTAGCVIRIVTLSLDPGMAWDSRAMALRVVMPLLCDRIHGEGKGGAGGGEGSRYKHGRARYVQRFAVHTPGRRSKKACPLSRGWRQGCSI